MTTDPRKVSLRLPPAVMKELHRESKRLGQPISKLVQKAWRIAKPRFERVFGIVEEALPQDCTTAEPEPAPPPLVPETPR